jgi:TolA-binding protein
MAALGVPLTIFLWNLSNKVAVLRAKAEASEERVHKLEHAHNSWTTNLNERIGKMESTIAGLQGTIQANQAALLERLGRIERNQDRSDRE